MCRARQGLQGQDAPLALTQHRQSVYNAKLLAKELCDQQPQQADLDNSAQLTNEVSCLPEDCL